MRKRLACFLGLLCFLLPQMMQAQTSNYSGKVTDKNGVPLPGAGITILSSRKSVTTNAEGRFVITAAPKALLEVSFTGYKTQKLSLADGSAELVITMEEDVARLDELIVTGLATTVKRRNAANAVAVVSSKDLTGTAPAQTLDAALNGKITGANITASSGAPGGGVSVKMRGVTTVYGNTQPLYVIDGVFLNNRSISTGLNAVTRAQGGGVNTSDQDNATNRIADINPADIENIEILKGASAAAIYGSQAAAGVVIITTKKGRSGKTKVNISQDLGTLSARHLMGMRNFTEETAADLAGSATSTNPNVIAARAANRAAFIGAKAAGKLYDYEEEVYGRKGLIRNSRVSLSGGNEKSTFLLSGGTRKEEGIIENTGYERSDLRLNFDHRISDRLKVAVSSAYTHSSADRGFTNNDNVGATLGVALSSTPSFAELHLNELGLYPANDYAASNPLETMAKTKNNELTNRFISGVNLEAILQQSDVSTTRLLGRGGIDFYNVKTWSLFPASLQFEASTGGRNIQGNANNLNTNWAAFLVNTLKAGSSLSFTTTASLTHESGNYDNLLNVASKLIGTQTSIDQSGALDATHSRQSFRNDGMFIQEEFSLNEFLSVTGGIRFDRSTNNGDYKKYAVYPKGSMSFNVSRMNFWHSKTINDLKFRVAYGEAGGFPTFNSRFILMPAVSTGGSGGSLVSYTWGDPNIKAERQTELEAGFDLSLLDGRISLEATYYNKVIKDLLLSSDVPGSTGFASKWLNGGNLRNRGMELGVRTIPVSTKNIRWSSNVNFWKNQSKVTRLDVPAFDPGGSFGASYGTFIVEKGKSATQIVAVLEDETEGKVGDAEPDFQMNFYNEVTLFKNLSFRFLVHWKQGGDNVNLSQLLYDASGISPDYDELDDKGVKLGRARLTGAHAYVQDAGFVRVREIGLYYRLPFTIPHLQSISIGASANNYITWTKYKGYDPEVSNFGGNGFSTGVDVAPYPASKRLQLHLSIDF